MLLVGGFKPIQKNYNNQFNGKSNFTHPKLPTKADSISFSARLFAVDSTAGEVRALVNEFLGGKEYAESFGLKAQTLIGKAKAALEAKGIVIKYEPVTFFETTIDWKNRQGIVRNAAKATLVDKTERPILSIDNAELTATDVTENAAALKLFDYLSSGLYRIKGDSSSTVFQDELTFALSRTVDGLGAFRNKWLSIADDNADSKAASLKWAYSQLLPKIPVKD